MEEIRLCEYGCGKSALYQFKNGKWCCSERWNSCKNLSNKILKIRLNSNYRHSEETKKKIRDGNKGKSRSPFSEEWKNKIGKSNKGKIVSEETKKKIRDGNKGKIISTETKEKIGRSNKGKIVSEETRKIISKNSKKFWKDPNSKLNINKEKNIEKSRVRMLNGGAAYANKFIKNPSKPELILREIVKELYPKAEPQYSIFNYSVDIALVEYKIAIEYDGRYHFDCNENIEYHKQRQKKIEKEGWKFLRYTMFDKFPNLEKLKEDIERIINV